MKKEALEDVGRQPHSCPNMGTDSKGFFDTQLLLGVKVSHVEEKGLESRAHQGLEDRAAMLQVCMAELREDRAPCVISSILFSFLNPTGWGCELSPRRSLIAAGYVHVSTRRCLTADFLLTPGNREKTKPERFSLLKRTEPTCLLNKPRWWSFTSKRKSYTARPRSFGWAKKCQDSTRRSPAI